MASVNKICPECGGEFVRTVKQVNEVIRRSGKWTCKPCAIVKTNKARSRETGSTRIHNRTGYVLEKTELGWERQHVLVIERSIGRKLVGDEVVHHIDENKQNNSISNLQLMTEAEHTALHNTGSQFSEETKQKISLANRKFSIEQARQIRGLVANGCSQRMAAFTVGTSAMVASRIVRNLGYRE